MADLNEEKKDDESTPPGPSQEEIARKEREEAIVNRVRRTIDCFANEEGGVRSIPEEEVGHLLRACGCFVPEIVLISQIMPTIKEDEFTDAGTVKPETAEKRIIAMIKERKWEADTEHELLLAFRRLDQLAHNGEEFGYIESAKMSTYLTTQGFAPFRSEENSSFLSYANDDTGSKIFYHDYIGKLIPYLEDKDYLFPSKS